MQRRGVWNGVVSAVAVLIIGTGPAHVHAQSPTKTSAPAAKSADKNLADELRQLKEQVAKLQSSVAPKGAVPRSSSGMAGMQSQAMPGGAMQQQGGMGMSMMESEHSSSMGSSPGNPSMQSMSGMEMSGMEMMGRMAGAPQMSAMASLPGFPGLSHLYHIGATDFFLDHPEHIMLTTDQKGKLGQIKEKALLEKATAQRKIEEAEQQLFTLTAADQPTLVDIQAKVREIGDLQGQQRIAYIQAVGQAAQVLSDSQRRTLVGQDASSKPPSEHH